MQFEEKANVARAPVARAYQLRHPDPVGAPQLVDARLKAAHGEDGEAR